MVATKTEMVTVKCPICEKTIEVVGYDRISRSDALKSHLEVAHTFHSTSNPVTRQDIEEIAHRTADEVMDRIGEREYDSLMLHSLPYLHGSPGVVVNEARAKATPCKCVEYKPGKKLCWSPGIIGALSDEQEKLYCLITEKIERPGTVSRMAKWQEAVDTCKVEIAAVPEEKGEERVVAWLNCMSRELTSRGIEI